MGIVGNRVRQWARRLPLSMTDGLAEYGQDVSKDGSQ
jgi:hypothetical protein